MKKKTLGVTVAVVLGALATATAALAATVVVHPGNEDGWTTQHAMCGIAATGSQTFENGPATPPAGSGSREFRTGADGDSFETYRNSNHAGTRLDDLTALSYSTYVESADSGQAPYLNLLIDWDNNGTVDDQIFFEPVYQNGSYGTPNQGAVTVGTWQTWNALEGAWWSLSGGGSDFQPLSSYIALHPDATLVNSLTGLGGLRVAVGCGGAVWANFVGNADAITIGTAAGSTTYDFEFAAPFVVATSAAQCKNGGWQTVRRSDGSSFKNQGDCIKYVNTGK